MGRPKCFTREDVLLTAIGVFWEKGFSDTRLQDLERATGVNKSGLYSEFKNKQDIFIESLRYYLQTRGGEDILSTEPKGWANVRRFLEIGHTCYSGRRGCFAVSSLRDVSSLPQEAREIIVENDAKLQDLLATNIEAALPNVSNACLLAEMTFTFFAGICLEQNAQLSADSAKRKIDRFMEFLASPAGTTAG